MSNGESATPAAGRQPKCLYHEASHARSIAEISPPNSQTGGPSEGACGTYWRVVLFYHCRRGCPRDAGRAEEIDYVAYLYATGLFDRAWPQFRAPVRRVEVPIWHGQVTLEVAVTQPIQCNALTPTRRILVLLYIDFVGLFTQSRLDQGSSNIGRFKSPPPLHRCGSCQLEHAACSTCGRPRRAPCDRCGCRHRHEYLLDAGDVQDTTNAKKQLEVHACRGGRSRAQRPPSRSTRRRMARRPLNLRQRAPGINQPPVHGEGAETARGVRADALSNYRRNPPAPCGSTAKFITPTTSRVTRTPIATHGQSSSSNRNPD